MNIRQAACGAAALDAGAIAVFAAIGRASHDEGILGDDGLGLLTTYWPFAAGAAAGWLLSRGWNAPCDWRRTGAIVWAATLVGGMALRAATGQGVQVSFVIVAGTFIAAGLIGWRVVSGAIAKRRGLTP
ncbi:DUF3054 domain-containing protein [Demequina sp. SYSU T00068]|uniref:DUF3054 domain-containing protein n=1 Tax=Demequina lignilytica TaxID=3051663 RepID=UPI00262F89F3|nr:DUF3054 domain-containing protein [Demequina sp. SYSU T00068]MDN4490070.1 DUF3054 domain-containing protein [Demequina sp. SYSU T00068]